MHYVRLNDKKFSASVGIIPLHTEAGFCVTTLKLATSYHMTFSELINLNLKVALARDIHMALLASLLV